MMRQDGPSRRPRADQARWQLLHQIESLLDKPMVVLAFVWLGLVILDFTTGLSRPLEIAGYVIWALFVLHFLLGIIIAPRKDRYLRQNWLTLIALVLPAFRALAVVRAFRLLRAVRAVRSLNLLRLVTSLNRGMHAVGNVLGRRGVGYVVALTAIVTVAGAAGMAQFESPAALREAGYAAAETTGAGLGNYGEALWWTAMIMTTMGSEYWPKTLEGRILGWLLAMYAFAIFGYITAIIASLFVRQDAASLPPAPTSLAMDSSEVGALRAEVAALRAQLAALTEALAGTSVGRNSGSEGR